MGYIRAVALLRVTDPRGRTQNVDLDRDRIVIGRAPSCDVRVDDPNVGSRHVSILRTERGYLIVDDTASLGVFLGEERVSNRFIAAGESLRIGGTELVLIEGEASPRPSESFGRARTMPALDEGGDEVGDEGGDEAGDGADAADGAEVGGASDEIGDLGELLLDEPLIEDTAASEADAHGDEDSDPAALDDPPISKARTLMGPPRPPRTKLPVSSPTLAQGSGTIAGTDGDSSRAHASTEPPPSSTATTPGDVPLPPSSTATEPPLHTRGKTEPGVPSSAAPPKGLTEPSLLPPPPPPHADADPQGERDPHSAPTVPPQRGEAADDGNDPPRAAPLSDGVPDSSPRIPLEDPALLAAAASPSEEPSSVPAPAGPPGKDGPTKSTSSWIWTSRDGSQSGAGPSVYALGDGSPLVHASSESWMWKEGKDRARLEPAPESGPGPHARPEDMRPAEDLVRNGAPTPVVSGEPPAAPAQPKPLPGIDEVPAPRIDEGVRGGPGPGQPAPPVRARESPDPPPLTPHVSRALATGHSWTWAIPESMRAPSGAGRRRAGRGMMLAGFLFMLLGAGLIASAFAMGLTRPDIEQVLGGLR